MKKAFDANVSRAKPRVRLGSMLSSGSDAPEVSAVSVEAIAEQVVREHDSHHVAPDLSSAFRSRQAARSERPSAAEALQHAMETPMASATSMDSFQASAHVEPVTNHVAVTHVAVVEAPPLAPQPQAHAEAPETITEVQSPPAPELEPHERRERLRDRLRAVRENPRPEPLPETVAEAGVLAVERISALQSELTKARAMNLALTQDLEGTRRQAERATEEARLRMDEARRLAHEMEGRVTLLSDLEGELHALEAERNEALLALQESRQSLDAR
ncbi:MAG: extensin-like protein, partial [Archangium sp.]|nr:extensin-like protein [Archangium sp.]